MSTDILTGEQSTCTHCGETIHAVIDSLSGCVDWGSSFPGHAVAEQFFDFGCDDNPISDEDGTGPHDPGAGHTPCGFKIHRTSGATACRSAAEKRGRPGPPDGAPRLAAVSGARGWVARMVELPGVPSERAHRCATHHDLRPG